MVIASLGELSYKITLDSTDFEKALTSTQQKMGPGGSLTSSIASGVFSGNAALDTLKFAIKGIGEVADFAMDTAKAAFTGFADSVKAGASFQMLDIAVKQIGKNAGISAAEIDKMVAGLADTNTFGTDALNVIRSLTVTGLLDMVKGFSQLDTSSGKTMHGLSAFTMVAKNFGATMGLSSSDAIQSLTSSIIKMRPQLLDELGIQINLNQAYEVYAKKMGIVGRSLNMSERQAAMLNIVMEQGVKVAEVYSATYDTMAKNMLSITSVANTIEEYLGYGFAVALSPATGAILDIYKGALALATLFRGEYLKYMPQINEAWGRLGTALLNMAAAFGITQPGIDTMATSLADLAGTETVKAIDFLTARVSEMKGNWDGINKAINEFKDSGVGKFIKGIAENEIAYATGQLAAYKWTWEQLVIVFKETLEPAFKDLDRELKDLTGGTVGAKEVLKVLGFVSIVPLIILVDALVLSLAGLVWAWTQVIRGANAVKDAINGIGDAAIWARDRLAEMLANVGTVKGNDPLRSIMDSLLGGNIIMGGVFRASGGDLGNGATVVGENGPEVIYKNHVYPSSMTSQMKTGGGTIQNVFNIDKGVDVDAFANRLNFQLRALL